jgi:hypothetical protein
MNRRYRVRLLAASGVAGVFTAYLTIIRPWALRWGATDEEATRPQPGDGVVRRADFVATRAITIHAPPEAVWPWLVQIGSGRAGWYSYDRLDNAGVPSAIKIIPELQDLAVGDLIPMVPGKEIGVWVKEVEPNRRMLWWDRKGEYSWEWVLEPVDGGTRLVNRLRATRHPWSARMLYEVVAANGDIIMMRKMLRGIKNRAERHRTLEGTPAGHEGSR